MIEVKELSKRYGSQLAVDRVSFRCEPGTVTGFLGPNGAGKSTTLRILCGLMTPTSGSATVAGVPYRSLVNPGRQIGILLDPTAQHAGRTGREVLALSAMVLGVPTRRVDELMEMVGLPPSAARKRVRGYSLGMRQRLGLAHALLGQPEVLVLDEPANGLDPEGIRWMRDLLRDYADRGGTVLLSSHLLAEVESVADRLVMIFDGQVRASGDKRDLLAGSDGVLVRSADVQLLAAVLYRSGISVNPTSDGALIAKAPVSEVGLSVAAAGIPLLELRPAAENRLEDLFISMSREPVEAVR